MLGKKKKDDLAFIERQIHNLTKLVDINAIINSTLDIRKLLTLIMEIIKEIMETEASTLLLFEEESKDLVFKVALGEAGEELTEKYRVRIGQGIAGWVAETRKPLYVNDVYSDKRFDPNYDMHTGFKTKSILCTPLLYKGKLLGVIQAVNPINRPGFTDEDMNLFKVFANQAALAVQNAFFFQNALEEERIKSELTSAISIQKSLIPDINEVYGSFRISAKSISAREVGGEFHGLYPVGSDHMAIALVDIHEKGIPGGLHASMVSGAVKTLAGVCGSKPSSLVRHLNSTIINDLPSTKTVSLFYGVINNMDNSIQFVNSGIAYPILIRDNVARYLKFRSKDLNDTSTEIKRVVVKLKPNDNFIIVTDGILNIKSRTGQVLGLKKVMNFLESRSEDPESLIESLVKFTDEFSDGLEKREDISILALKVD